MKAFVDCRILIAVCSLCLTLGLDGMAEKKNGFAVAESLHEANLRRSLGFQYSQQGKSHLGSITTQRYLEEGVAAKEEGETAVNSNPNLKGDATSETKAANEGKKDENKKSSETEELEEIEKEFDGEKKNQGSNNKTENAEKETEAAEVEDESSASPEKGNSKAEGKKKEEKEAPATTKPIEAEEPKTAVPTKAPVMTPTNKPTLKPYTPNTDEIDPIKAEDEKQSEQEEVQELQTELKQEEKVARQAGGLGIFLGIVAMIFTAHQMSENPDGIYASVCRLAITISSVVIKIICMPCRKLIGAGANGNPYSGHMPISTNDYSYRNDPYRSNANAGFELS